MLRFRPDLDQIPVYRPGMTAAELRERFEVDEITKLSSNECPEPAFPEVQKVVSELLAGVNRYPENRKIGVRDAIGDHYGVDRSEVWCGGAANELTLITGLAMGGPQTSAVFAAPSFGLYRIATITAWAHPIEVALDGDHRHDLGAMAAALRPDTTVVYVCNPNNPTGTHVSGSRLAAFLDEVPSDVLVVVDEAYAEYADAPDYESLIHQAVERPNLVVTRTFSKVYGLAGLRVGYAVSRRSTVEALSRLQLPFSVTNLAQAAAVEALRHQDRVSERAEHVARWRKRIEDELTARGVPHSASQTNFVYAGFGGRSEQIDLSLLRSGVMVRKVAPEGWLRITIGSDADNERMLLAIDAAYGQSSANSSQ